MNQTAHDFTFESLEGKPLAMSQFKGKTVLVVNTASKCSFSVQYGPMRELQKRYENRGFTLLGVPSNDFAQEPLDAQQIQRVCKESWLVNFPMTSKTSIRGSGAHPFFQWAAKQGGLFSAPKWNFHKYLIGPDGQMIGWYLPTTSPMSGKVLRKIEQHAQQ